jgi:hypothetical protein
MTSERKFIEYWKNKQFVKEKEFGIFPKFLQLEYVDIIINTL